MAPLGDDVGPDDFYVRASHGGKLFRVLVDPTASVSELKARIMAVTGVASEDQQLVFAGRRNWGDEATLAKDLLVKRGGTFMVLARRESHAAAATKERRERAAVDAAAAERLRESSRGEIKPSTAARGGASRVAGDTIDIASGQFYVRASHGGKTYTLRLERDATVFHLKKRMAEFTGITPKNQRIVFGGRREWRDDSKLGDDLNAKRGAMLMVLARQEHHDAVEARQDITGLEQEVRVATEKLSSLERKIKGRLLSEYVEMTLSIGEIDAETERLCGNIASVRVSGNGEDKAKAEKLSADVQALRDRVEGLRKHTSESFGGGG